MDAGLWVGHLFMLASSSKGSVRMTPGGSRIRKHGPCKVAHAISTDEGNPCTNQEAWRRQETEGSTRKGGNAASTPSPQVNLKFWIRHLLTQGSARGILCAAPSDPAVVEPGTASGPCHGGLEEPQRTATGTRTLAGFIFQFLGKEERTETRNRTWKPAAHAVGKKTVLSE
eukprot:XP_016860941.1 uncharacterized protein LOC105373395 isoform X2 [Homo sapiens]